MLIDWFTVGAQTLNFLILVWLMKRFLYQPILAAIDARETRIAAELAHASAQKAAAIKARDEWQGKNEQFDLQRDALLRLASEQAAAERARLFDEAHQAAAAWRAKSQAALRREQQNLNDEVTRRTRDEVFAIARQMLTDLAGQTLEECIVELFKRRLRDLDGAAKDRLGAALQSAPALVCCAFELMPLQRDALQRALNDTFSAAIRVRFAAAPELICGIELSVGGIKLAWSIAHYLASLEKSVSELLQQQGRQGEPESAAQAKGAPAPTPEPSPKLGAGVIDRIP